MLSEARIAAYRRMTPEERWHEVEDLMTLAWRTLCELPDEQRMRRIGGWLYPLLAAAAAPNTFAIDFVVYAWTPRP